MHLSHFTKNDQTNPIWNWSDLFAQRNIAFGNLNAERVAEFLIVHLGGRCVCNRHFLNLGFALQNLSCHFAGLVAEVIVADGKSRDAAASADTGFTGNDGGLFIQNDIADGGGAGSGGIVGGNVDYVNFLRSIGRNYGNVVGIGKGVTLAYKALFGELFFDNLNLIQAVGFGGAVQKAYNLGIGNELEDHIRLLGKGRKVAGAGNVLTDNAGEVVNAERHAVLGNGGAENRDGHGRIVRSLQSGRRVGHNEVVLLGNKAVYDRAANGNITGGVLNIDSNIFFAENVFKRLLKAFGCGVERLMGYQLAYADFELFFGRSNRETGNRHQYGKYKGHDL